MKRRVVLKGLIAWPVAMSLPEMPEVPFEFNTIPSPPFPRVPAIPTADLTLSIGEFQRKYILPAMEAVARNADKEVVAAFINGDQWAPEEIEKLQG